jgi:hypothetical protein
MCILARSKNKVSSSKREIITRKSEKEVKGGVGGGGYIREYVETVWKPNMKKILDEKIKIITNAGGK